jgi:hypothetical protein
LQTDAASLLDLVNKLSEATDAARSPIHQFYGSAKVQATIAYYQRRLNQELDRAVEQIIRMPGRDFTFEELKQRDDKERTFHLRDLPKNPMLIFMGLGRFSPTYRGRRVSHHSQLFRRLIRRINEINIYRANFGKTDIERLPHVIVGTSEYNTSKKCPRCLEDIDYWRDGRGEASIRLLHCTR